MIETISLAVAYLITGFYLIFVLGLLADRPHSRLTNWLILLLWPFIAVVMIVQGIGMVIYHYLIRRQS